jgi:UDP:flavonoid glycosyltransferase YjiC (YdhE family)
MARIVFCIGPLAGSVNASRRLAKALLAEGHEIYYTGIPDCEPYVSGGAIPPTRRAMCNRS